MVGQPSNSSHLISRNGTVVLLNYILRWLAGLFFRQVKFLHLLDHRRVKNMGRDSRDNGAS